MNKPKPEVKAATIIMIVPNIVPSVAYANGIDNNPAPIIVFAKLIADEMLDAPLLALSIAGMIVVSLGGNEVGNESLRLVRSNVPSKFQITPKSGNTHTKKKNKRSKEIYKRREFRK